MPLALTYGYCAAFAKGAPFGQGLIKYDVDSGTSEYRDLEGGQASEPVFVANPDGIDEDNGWVMSYVYQPERDKSEVLILNGQDITGEPAAVIELPVRVPAGFHGNWVSDND